MESSRGVRSLERTPLNAFLFYAVLNSDFHILQEYQGRSPCLIKLVCAERALPPRTILVGRIRKDARLYALPTAPRKITDEDAVVATVSCSQLRSNVAATKLQTVQAFAAGNIHEFQIRCVTPLRWKHAGGERQFKLLAWSAPSPTGDAKVPISTIDILLT